MPARLNFAALRDEFHTLIAAQGQLERLRRQGLRGFEKPEDEAPRLERLDELSALLSGPDHLSSPDPKLWSVQTHLDRWLDRNPLSLTSDVLVGRLRKVQSPTSVTVLIGGTTNGYRYPAKARDLEYVGGFLQLAIPESVAEHFRQQGRRQLQSELRDLLNTARA